jgi:hypothetical protein
VLIRLVVCRQTQPLRSGVTAGSERHCQFPTSLSSLLHPTEESIPVRYRMQIHEKRERPKS